MSTQKSLNNKLVGLRTLLSHLHTQILTPELGREQAHSPLLQMIKESKAKDLPVGVIRVAIDAIETLEERYGAETCHLILRKLIQSIREQVPSSRTFLEQAPNFELILVIQGHPVEIVAIAEFIRRSASRLYGPVLLGGGLKSAHLNWRCTVSAGVSTSRESGFHFGQLVRDSENALRASQLKGKNRVSAA